MVGGSRMLRHASHHPGQDERVERVRPEASDVHHPRAVNTSAASCSVRHGRLACIADLLLGRVCGRPWQASALWMDFSWHAEPAGERACSVSQNGGKAEASARPCSAQASSNSVAERGCFGPGHRARKHVSHVSALGPDALVARALKHLLGCWATARFVTLLGRVVPIQDISGL